MRQFMNIPTVNEYPVISVHFHTPIPSQWLYTSTELCMCFFGQSMQVCVQDVLALLHLQSEITSGFSSWCW